MFTMDTTSKLALFARFIILTALLLYSCNGIEWIDVTEETEHLFKSTNLRGFSDPKSVQTKENNNNRAAADEGVCDGYDGILKINSGDIMDASGASFFSNVINQILYAEENNLIPWVHFTDRDSRIYDKSVHDHVPVNAGGEQVSFRALLGAALHEIVGDGDMTCRIGDSNGEAATPYPGPIDFEKSNLNEYNLRLDATGVWDVYFEPISAFNPENMGPADVLSCQSKPFIDLSTEQQRAITLCAPFAVRNWIYNGLPKALSPVEGEPNSLKNWYGPMRERGSRVVAQYFHPRPNLLELFDVVHWVDRDNAPPCLAMHIRHTDKNDNRWKIPLEEFLPYAQAFVDNGGESIYLATNQLQNVERIETEWPENVKNRLRRQYEAYYSDSEEPIFDRVTHDRANREALIDIYAMARCGFMIHGNSAVSEATIYVNGDLHHRGVNLEDPQRMDPEAFAAMVREIISSSLEGEFINTPDAIVGTDIAEGSDGVLSEEEIADFQVDGE